MHRFTKGFLLALCSGFIFFQFSNAQDGLNFVDDTGYNSSIGGWNVQTTDYHPRCRCGGSTTDSLINVIFLLSILSILIILSILPLFFSKRFKDKGLKGKQFYIPILNLYPLFKNTIGIIRFYYIIFDILLLSYRMKIIFDGCCDSSIFWVTIIVLTGSVSLLIISSLVYKLFRK